ncbi:FAD-binding oxidoreductase [Tropicimonas sp. IMCC6043]|uniref:FAD-binding oxidoreductase n=1 Tax=Tropicimonas sp. IMCC6043 TaxID=2510645 RepID=UPI00101C9E8E|nr:FAD-binding oxidoreductase [Tropicimonas sp. IMCC6043]RYH06151.1 FAD-binding oxidoreductase [Tropicimonas sp. IMCC6043]
MTYETLKARIRGTVITMFDTSYAEAADALVWNGRKPERQATVIVRAASTEDVQEAVRFAAEQGLSVSARGGGHQFTGIAARAGMVIDLGALDLLRIDVAGRSATVGPAVTNTRLSAALDRHGLAFPVGHCGDVTVSGYLLGGGVGWNSGEWGIACFSVLAVDVVMADGRMLTATAEEHSDIFWAARGAGPEFFGIVVAYRVRLYEAPRALTSVVRVYPASAAEAVADWAERAVSRAPATVEFTAKIACTPDGPIIAAIANVFAAGEAEALAICSEFGRDAPDGAVEIAGPMPTPLAALYEMTGASTPKGSRYGVDSVWSDGSFAEALTAILHGMGAAPSPQSFGLVALRSNARAVPTDAAFSRVGRVFSTLYGIWTDASEDSANLGWLHNTVESCRSFATGSYVGESDLDRPTAPLPTLSAEAGQRLRALRAEHDPNGRFDVRAKSGSKTAA